MQIDVFINGRKLVSFKNKQMLFKMYKTGKLTPALHQKVLTLLQYDSFSS